MPRMNIEAKDLGKFEDRNAKESRGDKDGAYLRIGKFKLSTFGAILEKNVIGCDKIIYSLG
jgi:hypothetical protein